MNYHEYIASREWRQNPARLAELEASGFRCRLCNGDCTGSALEVHHRTYANLGNEQRSDLTTLCRSCHRVVTDHFRRLRYAPDKAGPLPAPMLANAPPRGPLRLRRQMILIPVAWSCCSQVYPQQHATYWCVCYPTVKIILVSSNYPQNINNLETTGRALRPHGNSAPACVALPPSPDRRDKTMQDILSLLASLRRPRLLIRAARIGADDYRREAHLSRILGYAALPRSGAALMRLVDLEADLDLRRRAEDTAYSIARHVEVLAAIMGEARLLRAGLGAEAV